MTDHSFNSHLGLWYHARLFWERVHHMYELRGRGRVQREKAAIFINLPQSWCEKLRETSLAILSRIGQDWPRNWRRSAETSHVEHLLVKISPVLHVLSSREVHLQSFTYFNCYFIDLLWIFHSFDWNTHTSDYLLAFTSNSRSKEAMVSHKTYSIYHLTLVKFNGYFPMELSTFSWIF